MSSIPMFTTAPFMTRSEVDSQSAECYNPVPIDKHMAFPVGEFPIIKNRYCVRESPVPGDKSEKTYFDVEYKMNQWTKNSLGMGFLEEREREREREKRDREVNANENSYP